MTFALSLWKDEATNYFSPYKCFYENAPQASSSQAYNPSPFQLFTGTFYRRANYSLPKQVPSRACYYILRAKCIRSQALYFLYLSHPPELIGKGWKRSYDKWSDDEEIYFLSVIWPTLVLNVSKQWELIPTSND